MIDVRRAMTLEFPTPAQNYTSVWWYHQHGGHAEGMRCHEVVGKILEHGGFCRIDAVAL